MSEAKAAAEPGSGAARPVVKSVSLCLAHVPDLVRYGSKPSRDLARDPTLLARLGAHRRTFEEAVAYLPNQVFVGNVDPHALWDCPEPWLRQPLDAASREGPDGEILPQDEFYALMKMCDEFDLLWLEARFVETVREGLRGHALIGENDLERLGAGRSTDEIAARVHAGAALPLYQGESVVGCFAHGPADDPSLDASVLLENLAAKASAVVALRRAFRACPAVQPEAIEYILGCGEEAVGDRYQRGGGNLAKAVGERSGCVRASGADVKAFCCAPNHALVLGATLVSGGLFQHVAVVGGGSLAKLGMKYQGHLKHDMPILEDVLASVAVILGPDDGTSPVLDLGCVGKQEIAAGSSQVAIAEAIVLRPLERRGLRLTDVDRFATELHNPEVTVPQGSGNVPKTNYRILASLAARRGEIAADEIDAFVRLRGMPGYSPTQGHIASAVPYLGHAHRALVAGSIERAFFYAKGSLFLGRMTQLSDGFSFLLRRNGDSSVS